MWSWVGLCTSVLEQMSRHAEHLCTPVRASLHAQTGSRCLTTLLKHSCWRVYLGGLCSVAAASHGPARQQLDQVSVHFGGRQPHVAQQLRRLGIAQLACTHTDSALVLVPLPVRLGEARVWSWSA